MNYERHFVEIKERVIQDLGGNFDPLLLEHLSLSLSHVRRSLHGNNDQYRSRTSRVPAYYNPNSHTIHLNINVLESADTDLIENIYYHELIHAASNHTRIDDGKRRILKSGLKIQVWDEDNEQTVLHRSLNEGVTQYLANTFTNGGPAYKNEVEIIGRLIRRIGFRELRAAFFGAAIDQLERKMRVVMGEGSLETLSELVDSKEYEAARAIVG